MTGDAAALKQVFQFMTEKTFEFPVPKDMAIINGDRHKQVYFLSVDGIMDLKMVKIMVHPSSKLELLTMKALRKQPSGFGWA